MAKKRKIKKIKPSDYLTYAIVLIIIVIALFWYYYNKQEEERSYTALSGVFTGTTTSNSGVMQIHFIDIGQGDCIFIDFPDGKTMLIDSGNRGKGDDVVAYLKSIQVDKIDLLLATHTDADHIGGMKEVFAEYEVEFCLRPFVYYSGDGRSDFEDTFNMISTAKEVEYCDTKTYKTFLDCILDENCGYEYFNKDSDFTQKFTFDNAEYEYSADFMTPVLEIPKIGYSDANNYSPIFLLKYGEFSIMFTGDAEEQVENELLTYYADIPDVDVLKVGHHGSESSTSKEFLKRIKPEQSIIMCGDNATYNHPRQQTLDRLIEVTSEIYRTDLQGSIVITVQASGTYEITTERYASMTEILIGKDGIVKEENQ